jgi:tryptophanyl-tRNA synthetase
MGDVKIKKLLNSVLLEVLEPIRSKRKQFESQIPEIYAILKEGSIRAREEAGDTLDKVRKAMRINYFDDEQLINEQQRKYSDKY